MDAARIPPVQICLDPEDLNDDIIKSIYLQSLYFNYFILCDPADPWRVFHVKLRAAKVQPGC